MQSNNPSEDAVNAAICAHLNADVQTISLAQRLRLDNARAQALVQLSAPRRREWFGLRPTALVGASAAMLLAVGVYFWGMAEREQEQDVLLSMWNAQAPIQSGSEELSPIDAALLADDDEAQVLDNLEFYAWLAEQQRTAGAQSGS